jgi:hypothetical protein
MIEEDVSESWFRGFKRRAHTQYGIHISARLPCKRKNEEFDPIKLTEQIESFWRDITTARSQRSLKDSNVILNDEMSMPWEIYARKIYAIVGTRHAWVQS